MSGFNFAVLISGNGSNLGSIIEHINKGKIEGNICCVLSNNPDALGIKRAKEAGIPFEVVDHKQFKKRSDFDSRMVEQLDKYKPNLIVLAGFMRILSYAFIQAYEGKILNIHPSLLPKHPGLNTHQRVLDSGDSLHGISIHFVDESLDGGPICAQSKIKVNNSNASQLKERIHVLEHELYPKVIDLFAKGRLYLNEGKAYIDGKQITLK
tara:strand:- start:495 stop:1121 length:627 start_codon:yes stop_codon:yes gene_type:complete